MRRQLHWLDRPAAAERGCPPLVFVHGGYTSSACWAPSFLPFFQRRGYRCYAVDLSGHGHSAGRGELDGFGLDDYAQDVGQLVAGLSAAPVLIGHSMGAIVVQRYLETAIARAVVLMAPVPPTGLAASSVQLALRHPDWLAEIERAQRGEFTATTLRVMRQVYFSPDVSDQQFARFQPMVQGESTRAIAELMALALRLPGNKPRIPALVIGGELDALFAANRLYMTAAGWNAETCVIARAGHMLMLDPQWRSAAQQIDDWLSVRLGLGGQAAQAA